MIGKLLLSVKANKKMAQFKKWASFGENLKVYHCSGCFADKAGLIEIGANCEVAGTLYSMADGTITIGDHTEIRENSFIGSVNSVSIGSHVIISNNIKIYDNNNHPTSPAARHQMCQNGFHGEAWRWTHADSAPVVIEDDVWIGERSVVLKGVRIGRGSIIGCDSVVTKDVPPFSVAAGNPARVVKQLEDDLDE